MISRAKSQDLVVEPRRMTELKRDAVLTWYQRKKRMQPWHVFLQCRWQLEQHRPLVF